MHSLLDPKAKYSLPRNREDPFFTQFFTKYGKTYTSDAPGAVNPYIAHVRAYRAAEAAAGNNISWITAMRNAKASYVKP
jgi:hypothetical protein